MDPNDPMTGREPGMEQLGWWLMTANHEIHPRSTTDPAYLPPLNSNMSFKPHLYIIKIDRNRPNNRSNHLD